MSLLIVLVAFRCDPWMQSWVAHHQTYSGSRLMSAVSHYGDWPAHVLLGLALAALAYVRGSKRWMRVFLAMMVACALAGAVARVVKVASGRARPSVQTESTWNGVRFSSKYHAFPSGHTAASTAFFATLAFASWRIGIWLMWIPLLIAFSRMYVAAHYLSDVVCAALLGLACAALVARWLQRPT